MSRPLQNQMPEWCSRYYMLTSLRKFRRPIFPK